jgi:ATP-dependent DNA helicase RecQ
MWRVAGESLHEGALIDLDGLPPGFGRASGATPLLDALQSRQFLHWRRAAPGNALTNPRRPLSAFRIDWRSMERRRTADLQKLDAVQQYAYTRGCRRGFVLRYFGDAAARPTCKGCDNCLGTSIEVETGAAGRGFDRPAKRVAKRERPAKGAPAPTPDGDLELSGADQALLAKLRDLRRTISKEEQVPAYVVFSDRTLTEMAVRRPTTETAMGQIRGVGAVKLERYGERFLNVLRSSDDTEAA